MAPTRSIFSAAALAACITSPLRAQAPTPPTAEQPHVRGALVPLSPPAERDTLEINRPAHEAALRWLRPDYSRFTTIHWPTWRLLRRRGHHELRVTGGASGHADAPSMAGPTAGGRLNVSVSWRWHGLFGGLIRPVVRASGGVIEGWQPGMRMGAIDVDWQPYLRTEAGVEMVHRGVGVGMTLSMPWLTPARMPGFYHPYLHGKADKSIDFGNLLLNMGRNFYIIWDDATK